MTISSINANLQLKLPEYDNMRPEQKAVSQDAVVTAAGKALEKDIFEHAPVEKPAGNAYKPSRQFEILPEKQPASIAETFRSFQEKHLSNKEKESEAVIEQRFSTPEEKEEAVLADKEAEKNEETDSFMDKSSEKVEQHRLKVADAVNEWFGLIAEGRAKPGDFIDLLQNISLDRSVTDGR